MALSFIKRVFTFGKDKPAEGEPPVADQPAPLSREELSAVEAELEPHAREEDLPLAADPGLAEEMDTAGGPSDDIVALEAEIITDEIEAALPLPAAEQIGDLGVTPLSLLEAEAEVEVTPAISPLEGEMPDRAEGVEEISSIAEVAEEAPVTEAFEDEAALPPSVPSGHLPLKGGDQGASGWLENPSCRR